MGSRFETHGDFSWCELMTTDVDAARAFYGAVFGWTFEEMSVTEHRYTEIKAGGKGVGGMMGLPAAAPPGMSPCWSCYVTVSDLDPVVAKVNQLGGKLLYGPESIPSVGRFAVIQDPQGAVLAAIQYTMEAE